MAPFCVLPGCQKQFKHIPIRVGDLTPNQASAVLSSPSSNSYRGALLRPFV